MVIVAGEHELDAVLHQGVLEDASRDQVGAVLAPRRVQRVMHVGDLPRLVGIRQILGDPRALIFFDAVRVDRDEVHRTPIERVAPLDVVAAIRRMLEDLEVGPASRRAEVVISCRQEERHRATELGVGVEEELLEALHRTVLVGDVADVEDELAGDGQELVTNHPLLRATRSRVAEDDEVDGRVEIIGRGAKAGGSKDALPVAEERVTVGRGRNEPADPDAALDALGQEEGGDFFARRFDDELSIGVLDADHLLALGRGPQQRRGVGRDVLQIRSARQGLPARLRGATDLLHPLEGRDSLDGDIEEITHIQALHVGFHRAA